MKKLFKSAIMAMFAIAVMGLAGCNKDDGGGKTPPEGTEALLKITLKNGAMEGARAVGTVTNADHTAVTDFSVFVFNDDGYCWKGFFDVAGKTFTGDGAAIDTDGTDPIGTLTVNTTATKVYVIANAGSDWTSAVTEEADLLPGTTTTFTFTDPWATGFDDTFTFVDDVAEADVTCTFIPARITVKVDNRMEHYGEANTVTIDKVAVINARAQSFMFPGPGETSLVAPMATFVNGIAVSGFVHHPASSLYAIEPVNLCDNYVYNALSTFDSYYYVLESPGTTTPANYPTIVTLVGTQADGTSPVYFPVHMASYEVFTGTNPFTATSGIIRGKSYDITIVLKGDASSSTGGGTEDPTLPIHNADIEVTVSINDWVPEALEKEFE